MENRTQLQIDTDHRSTGPDAVDPTPRDAGPAGRPSPRLLILAAAVIVLCVIGGALVLRSFDDTATIDTAASSDEADATSTDGQLFKAARLTATAAHEMEIETELAVRHAASDDDPAARREWEEQASSSDKAIEAMLEQLGSLDVDTLDERARAALTLIDRTTDSPRTARSIVGGGVTDWPAALEVYGNISGAYLDASMRLANSTSDPELNELARSWSMVVQIESDVARQRAMLTGVFMDGSFVGDGAAEDVSGGAPMYDSLMERVSDERSHVRTLEDFAVPEIVGQMRDALAGDDEAAADGGRRQGIDGPTATDLGIDVEEWRTWSGKKLDRIRGAETRIADSIGAQAGE